MYDIQSTTPTQRKTDIKIGYIGGGSRSWAPTLMNDLAQCRELAGEVSLYDVEYESARQNEKLGNRIQQLDDAVGEWKYTAVRELSDALTDSDFVIVSTQDPPSETFAHDCDIPKKYGIYQTVGDTVGPGGIFRGMRAIPRYREIADAIREHCPDALVMNYTNPMTVCTRTLYKEYPGINAIGLCHEVFGTQGFLAYLAEEYLDGDDISRSDVNVNVKGINHFTWIDEAYWQGTDLLELLEHVETSDPLPRFLPNGRSENPSTNNMRVTIDLFRRFGILPAAGDRHLAEFVPWYLDVDDPDEVEKWEISITSGESRKGTWERGSNRRKELLADIESFEFDGSGEEAVSIMLAWEGIEPIQTNVNHPNHGQMPDIETGAVVETNALITEHSVRPLVAGTLPRSVQNLVDVHVANQESLVEAGFSGDLDLAFQCFLNDPLVSIDTEDAAALFNELVDIERAYLEEWNLDDASIR